jgi:hypothetical protein
MFVALPKLENLALTAYRVYFDINNRLIYLS